MNCKNIRASAICIFKDGDRIFVFEGYDSIRNITFYRPIGGGIEFGEYSTETLKREVMEEINQEICNLRYIGVIENIFLYYDEPTHEICFIYDGEFKDRKMYDVDVIYGQEDDGVEFRAMWMNLNEFGEGKKVLYPRGLLKLIEEKMNI